MLKERQITHNEKCEHALKSINAMLAEGGFSEWQKFRSCNAQISLNWYGVHVLKSYNTIVAVYDEETGTGYDFLRHVYGYTATSAQHIAKFFNQYQPTTIYTWRNV